MLWCYLEFYEDLGKAWFMCANVLFVLGGRTEI